MEIPQALMRYQSPCWLLPIPNAIAEVFGYKMTSTEELLRELFRRYEQAPPVDKKTLNKAANGNVKFTTGKKIFQSLWPSLAEELSNLTSELADLGVDTDHSEILAFITNAMPILEAKLECSSWKEVEECQSVPEDTPSLLDFYALVLSVIDSNEVFGEQFPTICVFLKERFAAQEQLLTITNQEEFCCILNKHTLLSAESINMAYQVHLSGGDVVSGFAIQFFMDFFYQLIACIEVDAKHYFLLDELGDDFFEKISKPSAFSQLFAKSIASSNQHIRLKNVLKHQGKMIGKIKCEDSDSVGMKELAQYIPDATKSDRKISERSPENIAESKYRMLCSWLTSDKDKRKTPRDETLKGFLGNIYEGQTESIFLVFVITKIALAFEEIYDELCQDASLKEDELHTTFNRYLEYYEFTITRLKKRTDDGEHLQL